MKLIQRHHCQHLQLTHGRFQDHINQLLFNCSLIFIVLDISSLKFKMLSL